jgi:mannose-6-phosphate isomerase
LLKKLGSRFLDKVWGSHDLSPLYPPTATKTGEVWFEADGPPLPLLVKFIFTTDRLSVQVHPGDAFAAAAENSKGKTEMWHIIRADPGGELALGLREQITPERLREVSLSGEIEHLLNWIPVHPGDTVFVPAGTIHAIGAGLALCEIQQYSDVTYRLYDYGRPRELHLDKAIAVSVLEPHPGVIVPVPIADGVSRVVECPYFVTDVLTFDRSARYTSDPGRFQLLISLEGSGTLDGLAYKAGECWYVPAAQAPFEIQPTVASRFLRTYVP